MKRFVILFSLLLLVLPLASFSQEASEDFWEEQREYYQQYSAWELPTETIIEWLNQLEEAERKLKEAQNLQKEVKILSEAQQRTFDELQKSFESQQSQLEILQGVVIGGALLLIGIEVFQAITGG